MNRTALLRLCLVVILLTLAMPVQAQDTLSECLPARELWRYVDIYAGWLPKRQASSRQLDRWYKIEGQPVKWLGYGGGYWSEDRDFEAELLGITAGYEGVNLRKAKPYAVVEIHGPWGILARLDIARIDDSYFVVMTHTSKSADGYYHGAGCQWLVDGVPI